MRKSILILAMIALVAVFAISCKSEPVHEHEYVIEKYDETNHWKECECGEKSGVAKHVLSAWSVSEAGEATRKCDCGYVEKAEGEAIAVGTTADLKTAIEDGTNAIYLTADIDLSDFIEVGESKKIIINLNDKKIVNNNGSAIVVDGGEITINGNGTVEAKESAVQTINEGKATINSGKYIGTFAIAAGKWDGKTASNGSVIINGGEFEAQEFAVPVWGKSSATINGGTFTSKDNAVIGTNGSKPLSSTPYDITINGGVFNGKISSPGYIACGIYMANTGNVVLNGGTFNIEGGVGVLVRSGELTANKVEITLTHKEGLKSGKVGDSEVVITEGSQIVVDDKAGYPGEGPKVIENKTSYSLKNTSGNEYSAK